MNKLILFVFIGVGFFFGVGCSKSKQQSQSNTLVVGLNANYPPYESYNQGREIEGFDVDIAAALASKLGCQVQIKEMSFDALILALKQEKIDVIISGMSITESREKEIAMIPYQGEPVKTLQLAFWDHISPAIQKIQDCSCVSVQVGTYQEAYLSQIKGVTAKALEGNADLIMDLRYGKSDAALFEPHIATALQVKFPELQTLSIDLPKEEWVLGVGIGVKKERQKLIKNITAAVTELKEERIIAALEQKWLGGNENGL